MKVLVIDDSTATRFMLGKMMRELGFTVTEAADGKQAIERLKEHPDTQVALVDWNMPEMNGLDFVKATRSNKAYDSLKMMMVTTEIEMTNVVKALDAGANEYVMKPFTKEDILEKLQLMGVVQR